MRRCLTLRASVYISSVYARWMAASAVRSILAIDSSAQSRTCAIWAASVFLMLRVRSSRMSSALLAMEYAVTYAGRDGYDGGMIPSCSSPAGLV
jgi:hypothetical protein